MRLWSLSQMPSDERENILSQHRKIYDGYQTMQPKVENTQPLYVQDFAKDKLGVTMTNDGNVKPYTDYRVNESQVMDSCNECGGMMQEGECLECGWKGDMQEINLKGVGEKFKEFVTGRKKQHKAPYTADAVKKIIEHIKDAKTEEHLESAMKMFRNLEEMDTDLIDAYKERVMAAYKRKADELGNYLSKKDMKESEGSCNECGGMMKEGECMECGYKGDMEENKLEESISKMNVILEQITDDEEDIDIDELLRQKREEPLTPIKKILGFKSEKKKLDTPAIIQKIIYVLDSAETIDQLNTGMRMFNNFKENTENLTQSTIDKVLFKYFAKEREIEERQRQHGVYEESGKLDDIYKVEDLAMNPSGEFDYVEGGGNKYGTFEKMHHMKNIKNESATSNAPLSFGKHYNQIEEPYDFKSNGPVGDGGTLRQKSLEEQGFTGGGNAPDFDIDNENPAFNFVSKGPEEDTYTIPADDMDLDSSQVKKPFDFVSGGADNGGEVYPVNEDGECEECYEKMESAWAEDLEEQDISGVQGVYGDTKKPYAFVSTGPGKAGPYQTHSWGGEELGASVDEQYEGEDEDVYWTEDGDEDELKMDLTKFNPENKSWSEIAAHTGEDEFSHLDEDVRDELLKQKNKINEMFERFKKYN